MTTLPTPITSLPPAPARPADGHKGTFGTVIVIGGSSTMIGAPALCAAAALRGGAGLVKIATAPSVLPFVLTIEPGATGIELDLHDAGEAAAMLERADGPRKAVLAVGPGLGGSEVTGRLVEMLLRGPRAVVLDADGLNLLARLGRRRPVTGPPLVMTPHPGEFAHLAAPLGIGESPTDPAQRPTAAMKLAVAHHAVVVLKGRHTVVCDGRSTRRLYINPSGGPALATAGSGDVLTGLIAALLAQGLECFDAAALGVYLHGLAGDLWTRRHGPSGLTARDLAALLPEAFECHRHGHTPNAAE